MKNSKLLFWLFLFPIIAQGQTGEMAKKVIGLINEARTNPTAFFKSNQTAIENYNPNYAKFILSQSSIAPILWDNGLETMAKETIENKNLNPNYKGTNKICGFSSGKAFGTISTDPLEYVCDIYTNVHYKGYKYLGIYFNKSNTGYSFQWGISCDREKITYTFDEKIDTSKVDFKKIDTGANAAYMTKEERKMLLEINFVRAYPKIYAKFIAKYLANESKSWKGLQKDTYDAGIELMAELDTMTPRSILQPSECIYTAAKLHGLDCKKRNFFSHTGSNGSDPWDRITKQCPKYKTGNENGAGNGSNDPRIPVISLLLDDGISTRGHRYNILDKNWLYGACYRYIDSVYGYYWVQNFGYY